MYEALNSIYTYKGSDILINKLNIKDEILLKEYETRMVSFKLATITLSNMLKSFDINHLKKIHKYLFDEVYNFAGEFRRENITKDNFKFAEYEYIEENAKLILNSINISNLKLLSYDELISKISYLLTELNVLHPFRDGNGRTIRELIRQLLYEIGYEINFQNIEYNDIIRVSKLAIIDESEQIKLLKKSITKI
ncbi:MAG: Fic family protein [Clostridia bacterium]